MLDMGGVNSTGRVEGGGDLVVKTVLSISVFFDCGVDAQ